jgi:hypothetical protein
LTRIVPLRAPAGELLERIRRVRDAGDVPLVGDERLPEAQWSAVRDLVEPRPAPPPPARAAPAARPAPPPAPPGGPGVALPIAYGTAGTVSVAVSPDTATGTVTLRDGSTPLAEATIADGRGTLVLPAGSIAPGTHDLVLRYGGDAEHRASSSEVRVVVKKVVPTLELWGAQGAATARGGGV